MSDQDDSSIRMSVVLRTVGGRRFLIRTLQSLVRQVDGSVEVILPFDATLASDVHSIRDQFPDVRYIDMGEVVTVARPKSGAAAHELYDRRTSAGLRVARGSIVASLEDFGVPANNWIQEIVRAHELLPHGVIGGSVEQASNRVLNWAVYFLDFGRFQQPLSEESVEYLSDVNVSYKRSVLQQVRHLWEDRYNEAAVHWELARRGVVLWRRPQVVVYQNRGELSLWELLQERYSWGRLFGAVRARDRGTLFRIWYSLLSCLIPFVLVGRTARKVLADRIHVWQFLRAFPVLLLLAVVWCCGECMGYVTGRDSRKFNPRCT